MPLITRTRRALLGILALAGLGSTAVLSTSADAAVGSDDFRAGQVYRGDFADPSVLRLGSTYYAYATNTGGKLLPAMTSGDLSTWRARYSSTGKWWQNDALLGAPRWAARHYAHGKWRVSTWAPAVARVQGGYVAAYAAPRSVNPLHMCVTLAYSTKPLGPFVDDSKGPFVCAPDQGSIDPEFYKDRTGTPYLLWKNEGIPHGEPTRIWTRRMNRTATAFASGSTPHNLLTTARPWEGNVIENPSMVGYDGKLYLLYSANRYSTSRYAIGYAVCESAIGPCARRQDTPLLASGGRVDGPGGPDGFVDEHGMLRMAYAAWDRGHVGYPSSTACRSTAYGCNQRRLHTASLSSDVTGRLYVTDRG